MASNLLRAVGTICLLAMAASTAGQVMPAVAEGSAKVTVNVAADLGQINRRILGNNALGYLHNRPEYSARGGGLWDPASRNAVPAMISLARQAGVRSLRWPGGCDAHLFNWKQTIGPLETRPKQPFGLMEFLDVSHAIDAEPVITMAEYWGNEKDAGDLVEYLNSPVGLNANGGIDWAAVRARQGHASPFNVKWFEFGNESDHGPHKLETAPHDRGEPMTPETYAKRFRETAAAMKAIDGSIRLGAVLSAETSLPLSRWNEIVIRETGKHADFYIYHAYLPRTTDNSGTTPASSLFDVAYASADQLSVFFKGLRSEINRLSGRDIPIAVTEFNGLFQQDKPKPYRLSLGGAVLVADMAMTMLKPDSGIAFANYWQLSNEYWGMISGYGPSYTKRPTYHVFQLLNTHLGERLYDVKIDSPGYSTNGGYGVLATGHSATRFQFLDTPRRIRDWKISNVAGTQAVAGDDGRLSVQLPSASDLNYFHSHIDVPVSPGTGYRVTAELRADGLSRSGAQLEVIDGRGWGATKSSAMSHPVRVGDWIPVSVDYVALPDARNIQVRMRRLGGISEGGRIEIRNVEIRSFVPDRRNSVAFISALATGDRAAISVFLVNRDTRQARRVELHQLPPGRDAAWSLSGSAIDGDNEKDPKAIIPRELKVESRDGASHVVLPPHSFSVITRVLAKK